MPQGLLGAATHNRRIERVTVDAGSGRVDRPMESGSSVGS
jgi:hypothetical protein